MAPPHLHLRVAQYAQKILHAQAEMNPRSSAIEDITKTAHYAHAVLHLAGNMARHLHPAQHPYVHVICRLVQLHRTVQAVLRTQLIVIM